LELLNPHNQELTIDPLVEIREQSAREEAEEAHEHKPEPEPEPEPEPKPEPEPDPKERTMTVSKLTDGFGPMEAGSTIFEDIDCREQGIATTMQGTIRMLACFDEILNEETSVLD
jgi:hypothetical protein